MTRGAQLMLGVFFAVLEIIAGGRELPPGLIPCPRSHPNIKECIMENAIKGFPIIAEGVPSYNLKPLDPLFIDKIFVNTGINRRVSLNVTYNNVTLYGFGKTRLTAVDMIPDSGKVVWKGRTKNLQMIGQYGISGHVLFLPISGNGPTNITLENVDWTYSFDWNVDRVIDSEDYTTLNNSRLDFTTTRCHIRLDNLFNGVQILGDTMNLFLNANWQILVQDVGPGIARAVNRAFSETVTTILDQVPHNSIFPYN